MATESIWPKPNLKVERALGRFIVAWGVLEQQIDFAIWDLLATETWTGSVVAANLAIRGKLDLAHALFERLRYDESDEWHILSKEFSTAFDDLINRTAKINSDGRINIVHGQPFEVAVSDDGAQTIVLWIKTHARKGGHKGTAIGYSKGAIEVHTKIVKEIADQWAATRLAWKSAVDATRSSSADYWLSRPRGEEDRLDLRIQPILDSRPAKRTPPRKRRRSARLKG